MKFKSVYQLNKELSKKDLAQIIEKRKKSSMVFISNDQYFLSYDFSLFSLSLTKTKEDQLLEGCFEELNDFEKRIIIQNKSIKELEIIIGKSFIKNSKTYVFNSWMNDEPGGNSFFVNSYKDLISSKTKLPKDIDSLNAIYEKYVRPRNVAFKKKNVKKFHKFRDSTLLSENEMYDLLQKVPNPSYKKYLSFLNNVPDKEEDIISQMNQTIDVLSNEDLDIYSKAGIFLFKFLLTMPYYGILNNLFIALYVLTLYFYEEDHKLFAVSLWQILANQGNFDLLLKAFYETISEENHGDLSHFIYPFIAVIKDGVLKLTQELKNLESKVKVLHETIDGKLSKSDKKLLAIAISSSVYTEYGISTDEMKEETEISIPTINRFIKKMKDEKHLTKTRIGKKDYYKVG